MLHFCTIFDSYYLDKGLALYQSLEKVCPSFTLYIFCFDDRARDILRDMALPHACILHHSDLEAAYPALSELKKKRSKAEYCWTCTGASIEYVLDRYPVDRCTYLDADLYFFADPQPLFDEMTDAGADVTIVEHRFKPDRYGRQLEARNGKYCVQFNDFTQSPNARRVLAHWREQCFDWCYDIPEPDRMGDQKYLNTWTKEFPGVHELQHLGGGVAPWNLERYTLDRVEGGHITLKDENGRPFELIFYHFQNIRYLPGRRVNLKSQTRSKALKYAVYIPYLRQIEAIRAMLTARYGMRYGEAQGIVRSSNPVVGFLQKHFAAFKVRTLSDIVDLDRLDRYLPQNGGKA